LGSEDQEDIETVQQDWPIYRTCNAYVPLIVAKGGQYF